MSRIRRPARVARLEGTQALEGVGWQAQRLGRQLSRQHGWVAELRRLVQQEEREHSERATPSLWIRLREKVRQPQPKHRDTKEGLRSSRPLIVGSEHAQPAASAQRSLDGALDASTVA